jgi:FkbM family methyltransferase
MIKRVLSSGLRLLKRPQASPSDSQDAISRLAEELARVVDAHALERHRVACQAIAQVGASVAQAEGNIGYKLDRIIALTGAPTKVIENEIDRLDQFLVYHANRLMHRIETVHENEHERHLALSETARTIDERLVYLVTLANSVEIARKAYPPIPINNGQAILIPSRDFDFVIPTVEAGLCAAMTRGVIDLMEPGVRAVIAEHIRPGNFVIDAGANIGIHALNMAARIGSAGRLLAFEPTPWIADALKKSLTLNGFASRSEVFQVAVADVPDTAKFHISDHSPGNSLLRNELTAKSEIREVSVTTLDQTVPSGQAVDFVKMDVEGVEPRVWQGMSRVLQESPNIKLVLEWSASHFEAAGNNPIAFAESIRDAGFEMFEVMDTGPAAEPISAERVSALEAGNIFLKRR